MKSVPVIDLTDRTHIARANHAPISRLASNQPQTTEHSSTSRRAKRKARATQARPAETNDPNIDIITVGYLHTNKEREERVTRHENGALVRRLN